MAVKLIPTANEASFEEIVRKLRQIEEIAGEFGLEKIKESGREAGVAINPETPVESLIPLFGKVNSFLILGVNPGASGQGMLSGTAEKIRALRNACGGCIIGIDGGVTAENARELAEAGADYIVVASAIFG